MLAIIALYTCALPALILAIVSIYKIQKSKGKIRGTGLAIAAIIIATIELTWFVFIGIPRIRSIAPRMSCGSNLAGLSRAMLIYANDNNDMFTIPSKWCDLLIEHCEVNKNQLKCDGAPNGPCTYAMNKYVEKMGANSEPNMVLLFETYPGWNQSGTSEILTTAYHEGYGCNVLFVDGHVVFCSIKNLQKLKWKSEEAKQD